MKSLSNQSLRWPVSSRICSDAIPIDEQRDAGPVHALDAANGAGARHRQVGPTEDRGGDAERHVDVEDPRPRPGIGDPAAEGRTEARAEHRADAEDRLPGALSFRREGLDHDRLADRQQGTAAHALDHAEHHQLRQRAGGAAQERRGREQDDRADEVAAPAERRGEEARHRDHDHVGDDVRRRHPRDLVHGRAEIPHHGGQRDVDDAGVQDLEDHGEHHADDHQPLAGRESHRGSRDRDAGYVSGRGHGRRRRDRRRDPAQRSLRRRDRARCAPARAARPW